MKRVHLVFLILLISAYLSNAQNNSKDRVFETYDALVGSDNTGLYNGTEFTDLFLNTDGSYRYFNGFDYSKGSVTYNGQYYVNVSLKYDLLEDDLLARSDDNLSIFNIRLIPEFVDSFTIYKRVFTRLTDTGITLAANGFFEVVYFGKDLNLYVKHIKKKKERAISGGVQYKFIEDNFYVLKSVGRYTVISSEKDIKKAFPQAEDQIHQFYKSYKTLYKSNRELFMTNLVKYLDGLNERTNQL